MPWLQWAVRRPGAELLLVSLPTNGTIQKPPTQRAVQLPIFDYDGAPDIDLSNDEIAEILTREGVATAPT